jgi:4-azaleucine resistance transporter AzlC
MTSSPFHLALKHSLPVMLGYIPLGMAFGVLFQSLGYAWWLAPLSGVMIYAGSAQFLAVGILASGSGLVEAFLATLAINARHVFYGLTLINRYSLSGWRRWYLIFGLTDETYAVVTHNEVPIEQRQSYYFSVTLLNHSAWITGCALGAGLQSIFSFNSEGFEFSMLALFLVLLIDRVRQLHHVPYALLAAAVVFVSWLVLPEQFLLLSLMGILMISLLGYRKEAVI